MYVSWAAVVLSSFFWDRVGCNELFLFGFLAVTKEIMKVWKRFCFVCFGLVAFVFWVVATQTFFIFTLILGEMIQFDEHIFQMGWFNHQLVLVWSWLWWLFGSDKTQGLAKHMLGWNDRLLVTSASQRFLQVLNRGPT